MSHAVNLRARRADANGSIKKRRLSPSSGPPHVNGIGNTGVNGLTSKKLQATTTRDVKNLKSRTQDESQATVGRAQEDADMLDADQAEEDEDEDSDEDDEASGDAEVAVSGSKLTNGHTTADDDTAMSEDAEAGHEEDEDAEDAAEPSFGDLLRTRGQQTTTVTVTDDSAPTTQQNAILSQSAPSASSLGTVLSQALRTNDVDLLESCLQVQNLDSIRATIERLSPQHAAALLQKLAERMHKRPGRAGSLMVWVQWTVVAFGGYLAGQPAAMKQLQTLYTVVKQRATGLQPLLALKGKLDMLEAQMQLRRNVQARSTGGGDGPVIYVEGEEDDESKPHAGAFGKTRISDNIDDFDDSEDDEDIPAFTNGALDDEEDDDEDEEDDEEDLIDDEAEESEGDSDELSDDVEFDDEDEDSDDAGEQLRPAKRSKGDRS